MSPYCYSSSLLIHLRTTSKLFIVQSLIVRISSIVEELLLKSEVPASLAPMSVDCPWEGWPLPWSRCVCMNLFAQISTYYVFAFTRTHTHTRTHTRTHAHTHTHTHTHTHNSKHNLYCLHGQQCWCICLPVHSRY